jgi:transitional endoplasmic reticulum ATPase
VAAATPTCSRAPTERHPRGAAHRQDRHCKTLLARAVASECGVNFISIKGPELLSKYVGESERMVREVFKIARLSNPCIIFFDEIEAIASTRGGGEQNVTERVISQLLTEMDGIEELRGVVVLAATNRPELLDTALLRAGRFEVRLDLPMPDEAGRRAIFEVHTRTKPLADDVDLDKLAAMTETYTGSGDRIHLPSRLDRGDPGVPQAGNDNETPRMTIAMRNFTEALDEVRSLHDRFQPTLFEAEI